MTEGNRVIDEVLICCSARCLWDDLLKYFDIRGNMESPPDIIAVNDAGMHLPFPVRHWYSHDGIMLPKWAEARRPTYKQLDVEKYGKYPELHSTAKAKTGTTWSWNSQGTSSLGAAFTSVALGYKRAVICGAPLDQSGHYFDPPWVRTNFYYEEPDLGAWKNPAQYEFNGKISVISGRLLEVLPEFTG